MENKVLIVIDMQNDFISGSLGTTEAQNIVPKVVEKITNWEGNIIVTKDTHGENYLETKEGQHLPIEHCIEGTEGHNLNAEVEQALLLHERYRTIHKNTFGSLDLPMLLHLYTDIEIIGVYSDICVVSNALIVKTAFPNKNIWLDASCCAGTTLESHASALSIMEKCQIDILNNN